MAPRGTANGYHGDLHPISVVIMAEVKSTILMNESESELIQPPIQPHNIAAEALIRCEVNSLFDLPVKTGQRQMMTESVEAARGRAHRLELACLDFNAESLGIRSLEDAVLSPSIHFCGQEDFALWTAPHPDRNLNPQL